MSPLPRLAYSRAQHREQLEVLDDRELLLRIQDSDEIALDELVRRKMQPLVQVAYRILGDREEARDVVQIAFVRVWEHRRRYRPRYSANTWIYRIATNLAIDHLRSRRCRERAAEPLRLHLERRLHASSPRPLAELGEREVAAIFDQLAAGLTERQRAIFVMRELEGMSSAEVAEIVGCRDSTVRNHLFNARRVLREALVRRYPEYAPADRDAARAAAEGWVAGLRSAPDDDAAGVAEPRS
jgi:RNA polymerase sigma-70 factor (ECF subfamily)